MALEVIGVDQSFGVQQVTVVQMYFRSQEETCSREFVVFVEAAFAVVPTVALFEAATSVNVAAVEGFLALALKPGAFHLTIVDDFDLGSAYSLEFASYYLVV